MSDVIDAFEEAAEAFYKATGYMMPGKDVPAAMYAGEEAEEERRKLFKAWCAAIDYMRRPTGVLAEKDARIAALEVNLGAARELYDKMEYLAQTMAKERDAALAELSALKRGPDDEAVSMALGFADSIAHPKGQLKILAAACRKAWAENVELRANTGYGYLLEHVEKFKAQAEKAEARVEQEHELYLSAHRENMKCATMLMEMKHRAPKAERDMAEVKDMLTFYQNESAHAKNRLAESQAEAERLRAQLTEIGEEEDCCALQHHEGNLCCLREAGLRRMTEEALSPKPCAEDR